METYKGLFQFNVRNECHFNMTKTYFLRVYEDLYGRDYYTYDIIVDDGLILSEKL